MNSRPQGPVVLTFVGRGHTLLSDRAGPGIDWIVQRGTGDMRVTDNAFMHHNDTQLSDHPLLSVEVSQGAPTADT
jgi:hypothetical protein